MNNWFPSNDDYHWVRCNIQPIERTREGLTNLLVNVLPALMRNARKLHKIREFIYIPFWEKDDVRVDVYFTMGASSANAPAVTQRWLKNRFDSLQSKHAILLYGLRDHPLHSGGWFECLGGLRGIRLYEVYSHASWSAEAAYLKKFGSQGSAIDRASFVCALTDTLLETLNCNADEKIAVWEQGCRAFTNILRTKYDLKTSLWRDYYRNNGLKLQNRIAILDETSRKNLMRLRRVLAPWGSRARASRAHISRLVLPVILRNRSLGARSTGAYIPRYCGFRDWVWHRILHPCFNCLAYGRVEEWILTRCLIEMRKNGVK